MKTYRGAIIGAGYFAHNHMHAWRGLAGAEIVAICDIDLQRAQSMAGAFRVAHAYDSAEQMFREEDLDFVDIVTTVETHRPLVELAAANRVPAICQKPFASDLEDGRAMVDAMQKAGVPLMVHENFRWQRPMLAAANRIARGDIGDPFFMRISNRHRFDVFTNQPYLATVERFAILDLGIHILDLARFFLGEAVRITAETQSVNPIVRGEDVATMLLRHSSGATSVVDCSFYTELERNPFPQTFVEIDGSEGSLRLGYDSALQVTANGTTETVVIDTPVGEWMQPPSHLIQDSVVAIQQHWLDSLTAGAEPDTSGADNLETLKLTFGAYESAANERTITI